MLEFTNTKDLNLGYQIDNKFKYAIPDKRVLVYQRNIDVPKRFRITSAVYYTIHDLLENYNLKSHLNNILYIFADSCENLSIFKQRVKAFKDKKSHNSFTDIDELAYYYSIFMKEDAELIQINIKSNLKGKKHDITINSKEILSDILLLVKNKFYTDINSVEYYEQKKTASKSFNPKKYYDFMVYTMCRYFYNYFKMNCKNLKKYTTYYYVGQLFVVLGLLDTKVKFNQKNNKKYNYISYYKYLTDNIHNCLNRMPDFYNK